MPVRDSAGRVLTRVRLVNKDRPGWTPGYNAQIAITDKGERIFLLTPVCDLAEVAGEKVSLCASWCGVVVRTDSLVAVPRGHLGEIAAWSQQIDRLNPVRDADLGVDSSGSSPAGLC